MLIEKKQVYKKLIEYNFFHSRESQVYMRFLNYKPNISFKIESSKYILKTADNVDELLSCFELRYKCFYQDQLNTQECYDFDEFDEHYDHIIIKDLKSQSVIGTYRMANTLHHQKFYTAGEFEISHLLQLEGVKLELGRACIMKEFRTGSVLDMLWKGIAEYTNRIDAKYLFGCTSIKCEDSTRISKLYRFLKDNNHFDHSLEVSTNPNFFMQLKEVEEVSESEIKDIYPSLLKSYIKAGAKILATPAHDKDFKCVDFLTLFKPSEASEFFQKRYFKGEK